MVDRSDFIQAGRVQGIGWAGVQCRPDDLVGKSEDSSYLDTRGSDFLFSTDC